VAFFAEAFVAEQTADGRGDIGGGGGGGAGMSQADEGVPLRRQISHAVVQVRSAPLLFFVSLLLMYVRQHDDLPRQARDNRFRDSKTKGMAVFAFHVNAFAFHVNVSG
jgi:hypothetical protein